MLKSKKHIRFILLLTIGLLVPVACLVGFSGIVWNRADWQLIDLFYRHAVDSGKGPTLSSHIVYITITDDTYNYFDKNILDRSDLARLNLALSELGAEAVAYDIIFARPSHPEADRQFQESMDELGNVYLPIGFACSEKHRPFKWKQGQAYERLRTDLLFKPIETGTASPFYATRALMQTDDFSEVAFNSGHISAFSDPDGAYRRALMLLKIEDRYVPALTLAMFLDHAGVPFEKIVVNWGKNITIPSIPGSYLDKDVIIPIDERGRAFIPFAQTWNRGFKKMGAHSLLEYMKDEQLRGNLTEFFEGNFIFIGDVAVGTSDLGSTTLEKEVPLIVMHTALMNGMLTNTFYKRWSDFHVVAVILIIGAVLAIAAIVKPLWVLYASGILLFAGIGGLTWMQMVRLSLFPIATVSTCTLFLFFGLIAGLKWAGARERAFIKNAFSKYVPEKVVSRLLDNPDLLRLGGDEQVITVLFSDLADFTRISEGMTPTDLSRLLNSYLTAMTQIVMDEGGIIDKYEGDAVMAEFGAPLPLDDHADRAVRSGLKMLRRLEQLRKDWKRQGLPELHCRIGINTGPMVVGNMGSDQVFDYTVLGDSVNLASRLEGANKRYGTCLMISEFTYNQLSPGMFKTRVLDVIKVKGKDESVKVFEVYGEVLVSSDQRNDKYYQIYQTGFESYLRREFEKAQNAFEEALLLRPNDPASRKMIDRIARLECDKLPANWDGSVALTTK